VGGGLTAFYSDERRNPIFFVGQVRGQQQAKQPAKSTHGVAAVVGERWGNGGYWGAPVERPLLRWNKIDGYVEWCVHVCVCVCVCVCVLISCACSSSPSTSHLPSPLTTKEMCTCWLTQVYMAHACARVRGTCINRYNHSIKKWLPAPSPLMPLLWHDILLSAILVSLHTHSCVPREGGGRAESGAPEGGEGSDGGLGWLEAIVDQDMPSMKRPPPPFRGRWYGTGRACGDGVEVLEKQDVLYLNKVMPQRVCAPLVRVRACFVPQHNEHTHALGTHIHINTHTQMRALESKSALTDAEWADEYLRLREVYASHSVLSSFCM
jgi:hypothetical protein